MTPMLYNGPDHAALGVLQGGEHISSLDIDLTADFDYVWTFTLAWGRIHNFVAFAEDDYVAMYSMTDDQDRTWYAVNHSAYTNRSLHLSMYDAKAAARYFADEFPPPGGWMERDETIWPLQPTACSVEDEYRDPMEEPGASVCAACGLYPLHVDEPHECPAARVAVEAAG